MAWVYNTPEGTPTNGPTLTAGALAMTGLALVTVLLRLYVRTTLVKAPGWDDLVIVVAWLGAAGYTICTVFQTKWGLGLTSLDDMPMENLYNFGLLQYIGAGFYCLGIWGFKASLLLSYMRFMPAGFYRIATITTGVLVTMGHIAFVCVFLFMCTPISTQWDPAVTDGRCVAQVPFYLTFSALTIVFDLAVLILPFPVLLKSKIQRRKKVVLLSLFALGLFVTVIQSIRIQTITNLSNYLDSAKSIIWSIVENDIGIIICNIPTLAPLVKYFSERTRSGTGASHSRKPLDSRYAMQTWRSTRSGMRPLGSGTDKEGDNISARVSTRATAARGRAADERVSDDYMLDPSGIVKTTDVTVTRYHARSNGDLESLADSAVGRHDDYLRR